MAKTQSIKRECKYSNERTCTYIACMRSSCPGSKQCSAYITAMSHDPKVKATAKTYREAHTDQAKARARAWEKTPQGKATTKARESKPITVVKRGLKNHARIGHKIEVTVEEAYDIYLSTTNCRYCGREMQPGLIGIEPTSKSIDRIDNGDTLTKDNIQYICHQCNATKGAHSHDEYIAYLRQMVAHN